MPTYETKPDGDIVETATVSVQTSLADLRNLKRSLQARLNTVQRRIDEHIPMRDSLRVQLEAVNLKISELQAQRV